MCIFRPQGASVPRSHSTIESGVAGAAGGGGGLRRTKLRDLPGNAVNPRLQEKFLSIFMRMVP
jgi:hypothetical protein